VWRGSVCLTSLFFCDKGGDKVKEDGVGNPHYSHSLAFFLCIIEIYYIQQMRN